VPLPRDRCAMLKRLRHDLPLPILRPHTAAAFTLVARPRNWHLRSCPLALRGHDHRIDGRP